MNLQIIQGGENRLQECHDVFLNSGIYEMYFKDTDKLKNTLAAAAKENQLYIAVTPENEIAGVMRIEWRGFCNLYPYLALLGTSPQLRGQGIGKYMMAQFESMARQRSAKRVVLMVSTANARAKALYEQEGYKEITVLTDVVAKGLDEYLMIKDL